MADWAMVNGTFPKKIASHVRTTLMFATVRASPPVPGNSVAGVLRKLDTFFSDFFSDMLFKLRIMVSKSS